MGKSITQRQPDGTVIYKADRHMDIPDLDVLTLLLGESPNRPNAVVSMTKENRTTHVPLPLADSKYGEARPDSVLQVDATDPSKRITTAETVQLTRQLAHVLRHTYGVGSEGPSRDNVLAMTPGHYMLQSLFFATVAAEGIYSAASPGATPAELAYLVGLVEPKVIVCNADTRAVMEETAKTSGFPLDRLLCLGDDGPVPGLDLTVVSTGKRLALSPARTLDWERITDRRQLEESTICVLFSSGTTGLPKGVKISHRMMVSECFLTMEVDKAWRARERPGFVYRTLAHVPAAHIAGVQCYFVNASYRGGTIYWMARFDLLKFLEYNKRYQITTFFSVPPIYLALAKHPAVTDQLDTVESASSGAAPLGAQTQLDAERKLGRGQATLTQVWGLTETTGAITSMDPGENEYTGSVSPLVANHEARIVGDDGRDAEPGGTGEIWVRGPVVTKGYWRNDKANRESFVGEWFCTGDIGMFKDGMLYIVDRKKVRSLCPLLPPARSIVRDVPGGGAHPAFDHVQRRRGLSAGIQG